MDFHALGGKIAKTEQIERPVTAGRILHADADFFCYECSNLDEPLDVAIQAIKEQVRFKQKLVGAEKVYVHVTLGLKGGRNELATVKEYQKLRANKNPALKERVLRLREFLSNWKEPDIIPVANLYQEADDSLTQRHLATGANSVLMSGDKDLWMVEGVHADPKTGEFYTVKGYGKTEYVNVGNAKPKLIGRGTSWFWHQMIMGDSADDIPGLEFLSGRLANKYVPTKTYNPNRKPLLCGEAKAVAMLKDCKSDVEALNRVWEGYKECYGNAARERMFEQAFLLWMRRTTSLLDVTKFFAECGFMLEPSPKQVELLRLFREKVLMQKAATEEASR